jgi:hypothetical protein
MERVRRLRKRLGRSVLVFADQAERPAWNRPKSPPNSKANYDEAFFDSIDPERKSPQLQFWCSDDRGVANLGHHTRHLVAHVVAVKRPTAGIVGVKGDGDAAFWRDGA